MNTAPPSQQISPLPLHRHIAEDVKRLIYEGQLKAGEKLPSERAIAQDYSASRATVRTALQRLEREGLILRRDRRSSIVAVQRSRTPSLRIACDRPATVRLMNQLADKSALPPRCCVHPIDLDHPSSSTETRLQGLADRPDLLLCQAVSLRGLETICGPFHDSHHNLIERQLTSINMNTTLQAMAAPNHQAIAVPISIDPVVLFYNRTVFRDLQLDMPHSSVLIPWASLLQSAEHCRRHGLFALQLRPEPIHLATVFAHRGADFFHRDGTLAVETPGFQESLRFVNELLHERQLCPRLPRSEWVNPFANQRCAMAVDNLSMLGTYHAVLGDQLGLAALPNSHESPAVLSAVMAVPLLTDENAQACEHLLDNLIHPGTQRLLMGLSAGLTIREELLSDYTAPEAGLDGETMTFLNRELRRARSIPMPASLDYKATIETILLEFWLGLDPLETIIARLSRATAHDIEATRPLQPTQPQALT